MRQTDATAMQRMLQRQISGRSLADHSPVPVFASPSMFDVPAEMVVISDSWFGGLLSR
jgi:hypothetical protein